MYEEIQAFEVAYAESRKWVNSKQSSLIALTRTRNLDELELEVAAYSSEASQRMLAPGRELMATDAFSAATFDQKMGFTRFKTSKAAGDTYQSVSLVQRAISLQKNKQEGIIQSPTALKLGPARVEGSIGMVAEKLSDGDLQSAIDAYGNSQESLIKHAQIETIMASAIPGGAILQAMRIVGPGETCSYCRGLAGYWTPQLYTLRHFHNGCDCKIVTRFQ